MADPIQTNVQVQDIPEYLRDYRSALLNAAFQSVFSKPHLEANLPRATWYSAGSPAASTGADSTQAGGTTGTDTQTPEEGTAKSESNKIANALAMVSGQMPKLLGMVWDPKTRTYVPEAYKGIATRAMYKGGSTSGSGATLEDIVEAYENLRKSMPVGALPDIYEKETLTGGVTYPGMTNPFGGSRGPAATSSYTTGTGFSTTLGKYNPAPNISTGTPVTIGTRIPGTGTGITGLPTSTNTGGSGSTSGTPGRTGGTGVASGGSGSTGSGSTGSGRAGSTGSTGAPPIGTPESSVVIPSYSSGSAGTTPENKGAGGYNPDQYATDQRATGLASLLGGNVASTRPVGPVAPPSQNLIDFGDGAQLNAGLVDRALSNITVDGVSRARTPSEMTQSLAGLRDEISAGGGDTSQIDRLIQQNNRAYSSGATVSPVGQPAQPPASANLSAPRGRDNYSQNDYVIQDSSLNTGATGSQPSSQVSAPPEYQYSSGRSAGSQSSRGSASGENKPSLTEYQGTPVPGKSTQADDSEESQPSFGYDRFAQTDPGGFLAALRSAKPEPRSNRDDDEYGMAGGGLARFEIGDDGKVRNYSRGGAVRKADGGGFTGPNLGGFGATHTPSFGGFGGSGGLAGFWNASNPTNQLGTSIFNPPPVYGGQRLPMFTEDFGQGNAKDGFTSSRMTNQALYGAGRLPSIFTEVQDKKTGDWSTQLSSAGDFGKGVGSINFATDIAGEAADTGRDFLGKTMSSPDQQSYLMSLMPGIKEMGFKGPIKIDPLKAPTLQAPTGVTAAGLKDYQMEQPLGVSGENIDILGRLGGLNAAQVQGVPQVQQFQMQGPERVTGQTRDILSVLGDVSGSKVEGVPQVQQFQMGPAERVGAERTSVDAFGRPQAEQYMSPYMDAVTDVQKREASRQAAMQKAGRSAAAVRAGAFGGSRQAIQEGMAEEALQRQIGDIEATGRQRAFENAQAQFERDRAASLASQQANVQSGLQAALANQQAGVTTGRENLGASLATQQLGTQAGLQAALANQQAAQQAGLTKYGTRADILRSQSAQDLQAALANQQSGLMAGRENLGAQLATQQLGTQTGLQAALANQQAQQQAGLTQYGATADILRGQSAQNLQADLANQQAGLAAGRENLAARLGTQQLGAQQALQAQLANQQAGLTAGQGNLQSALATQQLATQSGLEAAKASQSGDLATWQMQLDAAKQASAEQEAARQRGFQNRLAAMQQAQAGAAGLAGLGGTMMGIPGMAQQLELQRLAAMQQAGGAVDARTQQAMDMAYQDYINQQNFPYQQMNFLQGIMSGVPVGMQVEGVQFQRPSSGGLAGLATAGAGLFSNYLQQGR